MNELKKKAYRTLIYQAFLDIKISGNFSEDNFNMNFRIAHAFHNLAEYSINDFEEFDEGSFWSRMALLEDQFELQHYRKIFDDMMMNN